MYEDAHLEMMFEDRQGHYDEGPDDEPLYDVDDFDDDEVALGAYEVDGPDPIDRADEADGNFTPGWEY